MSRRRQAVVVVAAVTACVVGACSVPTDDAPRVISAEDVPFSLLGPTATAPATSMAPTDDTSRVTVYFVGPDGRLGSPRRSVTSPATPERALRALLEGVTESESGRLSSSITANTTLLGIDGPDDGLLTIDLSSDLLDVTGSQQMLAIAQVVSTATSLPTVNRVLFEFDGEPREVPTGEGTLTAEPLDRGDYLDLLPGE